MGFSKLISNSGDVVKQYRKKARLKNPKRQQAITDRFNDMRGNLGGDAALKDHQLIDNMEMGFLSGNKEQIDFTFNHAKQRKDTWKFGNSDFMQNPTNSSKYQSMGGSKDLTRTTRGGTGDLASDGDYWLDLPEGMAGTVVKKL